MSKKQKDLALSHKSSCSYVKCINMCGQLVLFPKEKLTPRVSAYGIIFHNGKVLLVNTKTSGKYWFPGGAVELGESIEATVKREALEKTGIKINVLKFLKFKETLCGYLVR